MEYNKHLSDEQIKELAKTRDLIFNQIGKYEVQRKFYEERIKKQIEYLQSVNDKMYDIHTKNINVLSHEEHEIIHNLHLMRRF